MSVQYNGKHSIDIWALGLGSVNGIYRSINTWEDYKLVPLSRPYINRPEPHVTFEQMPGTNERVYLSGWMKEDRVYGMREGEWEFQLIPQAQRIPMVRERLLAIFLDIKNWRWDPFDFSSDNVDEAVLEEAEKKVIESIIPSKEFLINLPCMIYGITNNGEDYLEYTFIIGDSVPDSKLADSIEKELKLTDRNVEKVNDYRYYYTFRKCVYPTSADVNYMYRRIVNELNGQLAYVYLTDERGFTEEYEKGRLSVNKIDASDRGTTLTIGYSLYPTLFPFGGGGFGYKVIWYDYNGTALGDEIVPYNERPTIYYREDNPVGQPSDYHNAPEDGSAPDDPVKCNRHHIKKGGNLTLAYRDARDPESNTYIHTEKYMCDTGDSYRFQINWLHLEDTSSESLWYPLELETSAEKYIIVSGTLESPNDTIVIDVMPAFIVEEDKLYLFNLEQYRFWVKGNAYYAFKVLDVY